MARDLRVNAVPDSEHESRWFKGLPEAATEAQRPEGPLSGRRDPIDRGKTPSPPAPQPSLGTCLFLGPRGQRCSLPAVDGGFCSKHRSGSREAGASVNKKVVGAVAAVLGILLPYFADIVRLILRWIHSH